MPPRHLVPVTILSKEQPLAGKDRQRERDRTETERQRQRQRDREKCVCVCVCVCVCLCVCVCNHAHSCRLAGHDQVVIRTLQAYCMNTVTVYLFFSNLCYVFTISGAAALLRVHYAYCIADALQYTVIVIVDQQIQGRSQEFMKVVSFCCRRHLRRRGVAVVQKREVPPPLLVNCL